MKAAISLCFVTCVVLSSCSTSYNYQSGKITVSHMSSEGKEQEYELLSVRGDSAIVVLNWDEKDVTPIPYSHAEVFKKTSDILILRSGHGGGGPAGEGALIGGVLAGLISGLIMSNNQEMNYHSPSLAAGTLHTTGGSPQQSGFSSWGSFPDFSGVVGAMIVISSIVAGAILGATIANFLPPSKLLYLASAKDREFLRRISRYPEKEPEEMRYIK